MSNLLGRLFGTTVLRRAPLWLAVLSCGAVVGATVRVDREVGVALIALLMLNSALVGLLQQTLP